ncbi:MAG: MoaD/ThiS family protein [Planctomycetota bacterium]
MSAATQRMVFRVDLFAGAKQLAGTDHVHVDVRVDAGVDEGCTASDVLTRLADQHPELAELIGSCRLAVDCEYVSNDCAVNPSSSLALIPPVSGG